MNHNGELPDRFWIVVAQWDSDPNSEYVTPEYPVGGPIVFEGYCMTEEQADERIKKLGKKYGWITKFMVDTVQPTAVVPAE